MSTGKKAAPSRKRSDRLSSQAKAVLRHGSRDAIITRLANLAPSLRSGRWLPKSNRYATNTIEKLQHVVNKKKPAKLHEGELSAYVAVSGPLHCADGWSFLARATAAIIAGDANAARHLAYYAELRGAMSLMATQGVGIFSNAHFVVDGRNHCRHVPQPRPTHKFTWDCIEHWSDLQRASQPLMEMVRPGSVPIRQWIDQFIPGHGTSVAARWLRYWGVDLRSFPDDREARNEASYRPAALRQRSALSVSARSDFIESLWSLCEPTPPSRFEKLDAYILRDTLRQIYEINTSKRWDTDIGDFTRRCTAMLNGIAPSGLSPENWLSFLIATALPERPLLLTEADDRAATIADPRHHLKVVARAALLLRLATGASADLLARCNASKDVLRFWWEAIGQESGLWRDAGPPDDLTDLWVDVQEALASNREWIDNASDTSVGAWVASRAAALHTLGSCERIALWGLGL
jgi:hypothetical protein